ncbi:hypothetical protein VCR26J2_670002 [Vibrio coralliirubri]|nr:hypothetical protein VCR26J2_670002 [Vibrio coralliirubri]CDU14377.1 hypothetical protein VCR17J2_640059 [Vibrio coralliirubri]
MAVSPEVSYTHLFEQSYALLIMGLPPLFSYHLSVNTKN